MTTLFRVECSCMRFNACTWDEYEATKMRNLHASRNADVKNNVRHTVTVTRTVEPYRAENHSLVPTLEGGAP